MRTLFTTGCRQLCDRFVVGWRADARLLGLWYGSSQVARHVATPTGPISCSLEVSACALLQ